VEPYRCAVDSAARGEPLLATASRVDRWLLVEQPGPWGDAVVPQSRLGTRRTADLVAQARGLGARLLLVRRPASRVPPPSPTRAVFLADSRPGAERLLRLDLDPAADPAAAVAAGGWTLEPEPLFGVCAHGRHDVCCAIQGRPVAAALSRLAPEATWECSHIGGDRFAPNLLVLPAGLYYGRLPASAAAELVAGTRARRVLPAYLRGRSGLSLPAQAAQHYARAATGCDGLDDLLPLGETALPRGRWTVVLDHGPDEVTVTVARVSGGPPRRLTCTATEDRTPPAFVLVELLRHPAAVPA